MANGHKEISVSIPERLLGRLDLHFYDPSLGKPSYGARSQLIVELLEKWLEQQIGAGDERDSTPSS